MFKESDSLQVRGEAIVMFGTGKWMVLKGVWNLKSKVRSTEIDALAQVGVKCGDLLPSAHYEI